MTIAQQQGIEFFPYILKNKDDKVIYREESNGSWIKFEYDVNGNHVYYERSDGYCWKAEYDSNGNRTGFEDSNGYWVKWEYDSNGNIIRYEDSYGTIIDNQPKNPCDNKLNGLQNDIIDRINDMFSSLIKESYEIGKRDGHGELYNDEFVGFDKTNMSTITGVEKCHEILMEKYRLPKI